MAEIIIAKTKLRRGTDEQRQLVVFDQGEPVFTTDTKRLFVGIGTAAGGTVIGSKVHPPLLTYSALTATNAQVGDLVYANNKFYELVADPYTIITNWQDVGLKANPSIFSYDSSNNLQLNLSGLSAYYLDPNTVGFGLTIIDNVLQLSFDPTFFSLSSNALTLNNDAITEFQIASTSLSSGLRGGSGEPIQLDINPTYFDDSSNVLTLTLSGIDELVINPTALSFGLSGGGNSKLQVDIDTNYLGFSGNQLTVNILGVDDALPTPNYLTDIIANDSKPLVYDPFLETLNIKVDGTTIVINPSASGSLSLAAVSATPLSAPLVAVTIDGYGRVASLQTSMYDLIEVDMPNTNLQRDLYNGASTVDFDYSSLSNSIEKFNGTLVNGLSAVSLSSAGMMAFEGLFPVRGLSAVVMKRFAIPVYVF